MPEQITKFPDVTLQVLKESGAVCGAGAEQKILKHCPADRFCSLRAGEICVFGLDDIERLTQISKQELAQIVCPQARPTALSSFPGSAVDPLLLGALFVSGVAVGRGWGKLRWPAR